ncbi:MAG: Gfo/Idh/MocA family oxidoreductase [Clostridiales bacterium]|nr:Gfo/Idh/MocA family oxidoreductase [Clostridiales bacterium]
MIRIGLIGCGAIGRQHAHRLHCETAGVTLTGVADFLPEAAQKVAADLGVRAFASGEELIASPDVDAVFVTTPDAFHAQYVLASIEAGKYCFCEKPLAPTVEECLKIMDAEVRHGKRLVQVGYMRRYDKDYMEMKRLLDEGSVGRPLILHMAHRNVSQPDWFRTEMAVSNSAIHEIDICRYLTGEEFVSGQVLKVRQSTESADKPYENPQIMLLETESGARLDIEYQCGECYGYEVECRIVCDRGMLELPQPSTVIKRSKDTHSCSTDIMQDWSVRFIDAYPVEFAAWVRDLENGKLTGPSVWDGYAACQVADSLNASRGTGKFMPIKMVEKPDLYR